MNQHMVQNVSFAPDFREAGLLWQSLDDYRANNPEANQVDMDDPLSGQSVAKTAFVDFATDHEELFLDQEFWHEDWESGMLLEFQKPDGTLFLDDKVYDWEGLNLSKGTSNPWHDQCLNWVNQLTCMTSLNAIELFVESIEKRAEGRALDIVYQAYNARLTHLQMREHVNMLKREESKRVFVVVEKVQYPLIMRKAGAKVLAFNPKKAKEYELAGYRA